VRLELKIGALVLHLHAKSPRELDGISGSIGGLFGGV